MYIVYRRYGLFELRSTSLCSLFQNTVSDYHHEMSHDNIFRKGVTKVMVKPTLS